MFKIWKVTGSYLRFYKKQTLSLLMGIMLSAVLISGIGSLIYSGKKADLEQVRRQDGDWHYQITDENNLSAKVSKKRSGQGYKLENFGVMRVKKITEEPYPVTFSTADSQYMEMMGRTLVEGSYPVQPDEIAMDYHTITNLGISDKIGDSVEVCKGRYTLCGILEEGPQDSSGDMKVFVSTQTVMDMDIPVLYIKFDETQKVHGQMEAFAKYYGIQTKDIIRNNSVTAFVGGESSESVAETLQLAFTNPDAGLPYLIGSLNESVGLVDKVVFSALILFGAYIVYSLYSITLAKRKSDYTILQAVGLEDKHLFSIMLTELLLIMAVGYPAGCAVGNGIAGTLYSKIGFLFSAQSLNTPFYVSVSTIWHGTLFFFLFMILICYLMVRKMSRRTAARGGKTGKSGEKRNRKIYSGKSGNLTGLLTRRFMFGKRSTFVGIIISLSLGGILFLGTAYTAQSTRVNMNHSFQTDEGLGSDMGVYIDSENGSYSIPKKMVEQIKKIDGISQAEEMSYLLGEIPLNPGILKWKSFFPEISGNSKQKQSQRILDHYNGIITEQGPDMYRLKVNVYGYTDAMLDQLKDYLVEGTIDPAALKEENSVILKTLTDGQGNTGGVAIQAGDTIKLKVPKTMDDAELLKFQSDDSEYIEKEFTVAAIVNRPLAKNEYFIGDDGRDEVDVIMPDARMSANFNVSGYNTISVDFHQNADRQSIAREIRSITSGLNRCIVKDYTEEITQKNAELNQKVYFFYGIAAILLCISLLHIVNSMKHIVLSRRHEFGILRAMGITDRGFRMMLVREGIRYAAYTSIFLLLTYIAVHQMLYFMMKKVYLYVIVENNYMLPQCLIVIGLNLLVCIATLVTAGNTLLKEEIVTEI